MSRRSRTFKREIIPDPIHKDLVIAKFINKIMLRGQKSTAQKLFYGALEELNGKVQGEDSLAILKKAIEKRKYKDITYKYNLLEESPSKVAFLRFSSNGALMKVTLHLKNVMRVPGSNEVIYIPDL